MAKRSPFPLPDVPADRHADVYRSVDYDYRLGTRQLTLWEEIVNTHFGGRVVVVCSVVLTYLQTA